MNKKLYSGEKLNFCENEKFQGLIKNDFYARFAIMVG